MTLIPMGIWSASGSDYSPLPSSFDVSFLSIAGGGGGGGTLAGGGGAGGYRTSVGTSGGSTSAESDKNVTISTAYPVIIGAGGAGSSTATKGTSGNDSVFADLTSVGGGGSGTFNGRAG